MMINGVATAGVVSFLTSTAAFATVAATIAPVMVFLAVAGMARRSEELRSASLAMSDIAVRLTEPEINATEGVVNIGQAIRREVNGMSTKSKSAPSSKSWSPNAKR